MKQIKLKEIANLYTGTNQSRIKKEVEDQVIDVYDKNAFDNDYKQMAMTKYEMSNFEENNNLQAGDIVINNATYFATLVSKESSDKVLPNNFTRIVLKSDKIDPYYFLYLFNESEEIQKQKSQGIQGNTVAVRKIPTSELGNFSFPIVPLEKQKDLGEIYFESLKLSNQLEKYKELMKEFALQTIDKQLNK